MRLLERCGPKWWISRKTFEFVLFCSVLEDTTKPFKNLMFLKDFTAGPRRNTLDPMGAFVSLRNHCQQQLVALFAYMLHLRGRKGKLGIHPNVCIMNEQK